MPRSREMNTWNGNVDGEELDSGEGILVASHGGGAEACFSKVIVNININAQNLDSGELDKLASILERIRQTVAPTLNKEVKVR